MYSLIFVQDSFLGHSSLSILQEPSTASAKVPFHSRSLIGVSLGLPSTILIP